MKCFWCKKPLDFSESAIDHVIAQSTSKLVLGSMIKDYQLGDDFSIDDYGNRVPACAPCIKKRAAGAYRQSSSFPSWFEMIRNRVQQVEAKVRKIEAEHESALRTLVEKTEQGELTREDVERIAGPFLRSIEGIPKSTVEFRLSRTTRLLSAPDGVRLVPQSEIRYEKFVETIVESGDWKKRKPVEQLREGPSFGEGRPRKPGSGA